MAYFKRAEFWHRTRCLSEDFEAFRKRDLSNEKLLYLELDGTYLESRGKDRVQDSQHHDGARDA